MTDSNETLKFTPLKSRHEELGAKMVPFAGWLMPVQYQGLRDEHMKVRSSVGLFDVSHMGEIRVKGPKALGTCQWLTSNDVSKLESGQAQYSLFINENGGVVDDLIVYCLKKNEDYLLCVNAANTDKDWAFVQKHNQGAEIENQSLQWGQIAVQGPKAISLLDQIFPETTALKGFELRSYQFQGVTCLVARTGYTGEDGAEVFVPWDQTVALWNELLEKGQDFGVTPVGLGARDTLRTEVKYPLYGHELGDHLNPYSAGLGWVIKPDAKDFVGKDRLLEGKKQALLTKLIGFVMKDKAIARAEYPIVDAQGAPLGVVTSGTPSPSTAENIGIGYVPKDFAAEGSEIFIEIRGRKVKAQVVKTPFVSKE
jgi:aminomethyltransferase